jgi:hypothetical protein
MASDERDEIETQLASLKKEFEDGLYIADNCSLVLGIIVIATTCTCTFIYVLIITCTHVHFRLS